MTVSGINKSPGPKFRTGRSVDPVTAQQTISAMILPKLMIPIKRPNDINERQYQMTVMSLNFLYLKKAPIFNHHNIEAYAAYNLYAEYLLNKLFGSEQLILGCKRSSDAFSYR